MKRTPWFPGHIKPARPGVYEQEADRGEIGYQYFDGKSWYCWGRTIWVAVENSNLSPSMFQNDPWRGLAEKPE